MKTEVLPSPCDVVLGQGTALHGAPARKSRLRPAQFPNGPPVPIALSSDVLDALPANIAVLDANGAIVAVNKGWRTYALMNRGLDNHGVGSNYLTACDRVLGESAADAQRAAAGIRAVLRGEVDTFRFEYAMPTASGNAWYLMMVTPMGGVHPTGAAVLHLDITARKMSEDTIWRFAAAMDAMADGVFLIDRATMGYTYVNDAACRLHGLPRQQLLTLKPWEVMGISRTELERKYDHIVTQGGTGQPEEILWRRAGGPPLWIEVRRHAHCLDGAASIMVLVRDITARRLYESRIIHLNRVYGILSGINTLIVRVENRDELFRGACRIPVEEGSFPACWIGVVQPETQRVTVAACAGMSADFRGALVGTLGLGSSQMMEAAYVLAAVRTKKVAVCNNSPLDSRVSVREHHGPHEIRSFAVLPLVVGGEVVGVLGLYASEIDFFQEDALRLLADLGGDIAFAIDHLDKQERLDYLAYYDALTGLANRRLFLDRLTQQLRGANEAGGKLAVCIADIERFRHINDSLGRSAGDAVLRQISAWLLEYFGDAGMLGHMDSDHFGIVLAHAHNEEQVATQVEALINAFQAHAFELDGVAYRIALRVGVAMSPDDGDDADSLFKYAGAALTKAKAGRDRYLFYAQKMIETVAGRLGMETQLRRALALEEFEIHYQPKMNLASGRVVGAEALLRWNDPRTGMVPPARFISVLEETGLIFEVGLWVLRKVVDDHMRWRRMGLPGVRIAINVSPLQLRQREFAADVLKVASVHESVAAALEMEITESVIMDDVTQSVKALQVIRESGITVAIDDFGTGYSSLSHLAKLPIDTLKIDRSFIMEMITGSTGLSVVSAIINLAHTLGLKVVAEGVETTEQESMLQALQCDEVQGYLFSKPLPVTAFEENFLKRTR